MTTQEVKGGLEDLQEKFRNIPMFQMFCVLGY